MAETGFCRQKPNPVLNAVLCCPDSTDGRGGGGDVPAAVVAVLPGDVHHASAEAQLPVAAELPLHDADDTSHRLHQQCRQPVRLRLSRRQISNSVHGQRTKRIQ